jgi:methionyl-tRNA synthetase
MIFKNMDGKLGAFSSVEADDALLAHVALACSDELPPHSPILNFSAGIDAWMRAVFACNAYIDEQAPWTLRKTDPERMRAVLLTCSWPFAISPLPSPDRAHGGEQGAGPAGHSAGERNIAFAHAGLVHGARRHRRSLAQPVARSRAWNCRTSRGNASA